MNFRILMLAVGTFALGTELLVIEGILPEIAQDIHVSTSVAGQLISVFALVYGVSAPLLSVAVTRIPPKQFLAGTLILFTLSNIVAALALSFPLLMVARVMAALSACLFTPNASAIAASMVPAQKRGQALSIVYGGLSSATVIGVPLGTLIGGLTSWRMTFIFVAILSTIAAIGIILFLPKLDRRPAMNMRTWFGLVSRPSIFGIVLATTLFMTAQFTVYTYIAPVTHLLTNGGNNTVAIVLLIFGIFSITGNFLGGQGADRFGPIQTSFASIIIFGLTFVGIGLLSHLPISIMSLIAGVLALICWGISGWAFTPVQQYRLLEVAPEAGGVVLSINASALYLGIALGGAVGGYFLNIGQLANLGFISACFIAVTLLLVTFLSIGRKKSKSEEKVAQLEVLGEVNE